MYIPYKGRTYIHAYSHLAITEQVLLVVFTTTTEYYYY